MTLEELIRFHTEEAEKMKLHKKVNEIFLGSEGYLRALQEHTQTAEWLKELQERRKQPEIIYCGECELKIECCRNLRSGGRKDDDFCSCGRRSERRTDEQTESDAGD